MNILVACEESQAVTKELRALGHEAFSCDIIETSGGRNEWHIMQDVIPLLNGNCKFKTADGAEHEIIGPWDMLLAFPPCTHLAASGARHFEKKRADGRQAAAIEFFCKFLNTNCPRVAIENPVGIISGDYIAEHYPLIAKKYGLPLKPTQKIQPFYFGDAVRKNTCLWLKNLQPLKATNIIEPQIIPGGKAKNTSFSGPAIGVKDENGKYIRYNDERTARERSKTYPGIARAMAQQWAGPCHE